MPLIAVVPVVSIGAILVLILGISSVPFKSFKHRYLLSSGTFLTNHDVTTVERKTAEFWLVLSYGIIWYENNKYVLKENSPIETSVPMFTNFCWIILGFSGEFVHVNPYTGPPTWGELTEKAAQTMFYTVSSFFEGLTFLQGHPLRERGWWLMGLLPPRLLKSFGGLFRVRMPFRCLPRERILRALRPLRSWSISGFRFLRKYSLLLIRT